MVLGFILYESIDLVYNAGKLSYNAVTGAYNWYYQIESPEVEERKREMNKILTLENKIDKLSKLVMENNLKSKIDQLKMKVEDKK